MLKSPLTSVLKPPNYAKITIFFYSRHRKLNRLVVLITISNCHWRKCQYRIITLWHSTLLQNPHKITVAKKFKNNNQQACILDITGGIYFLENILPRFSLALKHSWSLFRKSTKKFCNSVFSPPLNKKFFAY